MERKIFYVLISFHGATALGSIQRLMNYYLITNKLSDMPKDYPRFKSGTQLSFRSILIWRIIQTLVWLAGASILFFLVFYPVIGISMFWNILIPVAPALLVVFTGVWRNVCPMATNALLPRHLGLSKRKRLSTTQIAKLNLVAIIALYVIVPLRHAFFNTNGFATAILIVSMVLISFVSGFLFEWKSAWCSGLCPVHQVEKLYGTKSLFAIPNAHCGQCMNCVIPCPDSTPGMHPLSTKKTVYHKISGYLLVGGFPGFVWGWFHVPDHAGQTGIGQLVEIYTFPLLGAAVTLILFGIVKKIFTKTDETTIISIFAASAVVCYYWYRIPSLFGFAFYENDGMLVNLKNSLPRWMINASIISTTIFFFWWIVFRERKKTSWIIRPEFAIEKENYRRNSSTTNLKAKA